MQEGGSTNKLVEKLNRGAVFLVTFIRSVFQTWREGFLSGE